MSSWELMFPETDSSIYICMIRQKEQIYPPARVINPSPSISADGVETWTWASSTVNFLDRWSPSLRKFVIIDLLSFAEPRLETRVKHPDRRLICRDLVSVHLRQLVGVLVEFQSRQGISNVETVCKQAHGRDTTGLMLTNQAVSVSLTKLLG